MKEEYKHRNRLALDWIDALLFTALIYGGGGLLYSLDMLGRMGMQLLLGLGLALAILRRLLAKVLLDQKSSYRPRSVSGGGIFSALFMVSGTLLGAFALSPLLADPPTHKAPPTNRPQTYLQRAKQRCAQSPIPKLCIKSISKRAPKIMEQAQAYEQGSSPRFGIGALGLFLLLAGAFLDALPKD